MGTFAPDFAANVDDTWSSFISSAPNSAKRSLFEEDQTSSKRVRLSDYATGQSAGPSSSTMVDNPPRATFPPPDTVTSLPPAPSTTTYSSAIPAQSRALLSTRVDNAVGTQAEQRFNAEVRQPLLFALDILKHGCIMCLLAQRPDWDSHDFDSCSGTAMHYRQDTRFAEFKRRVKFNPGFCFGCGLRTVRAIQISIVVFS